MSGSIGQFAIRTAIVVAAVIITFGVALLLVDSFVEARIEQLQATIKASTKIGGKQFWSKIEEELEKQSDTKADLSPEKKQKLLAEIRVLSNRWRPFIQEVITVASPDAKEPAKQ